VKALALTRDQAACLWSVAASRAASSARFAIVGMEDLAQHGAAVRMVKELQSEDWAGVQSHNALAGANNLAVAIVLRIEAKEDEFFWTLLRSPFDSWESASLEAFAPVGNPARLPRTLEWHTLEQPGKAIT
jgi:hypothetical protein